MTQICCLYLNNPGFDSWLAAVVNASGGHSWGKPIGSDYGTKH